MPASKPNQRPPEESSRLIWLTDVSKAAQQLTQLTLESSAQAAFITRQNDLWAYAGQLSREAAQELTDSIQRYWASEGESDLLRFVRLQATDAQHMLYVRKLSDKMTLALVFDAETPFSTIRSQAGKLVRNLFDGAPTELIPPPVSIPVAASPVSTPAAIAAAPTAPDDEQFDGGDYQDVPPISDLLGEIPPPIPPKVALKINLPWEQSSPSAPAQTRISPPEAENRPVTSKMSAPPESGNRVSFESNPAIRLDAFKRPVPAMDETFSVRPATAEPESPDEEIPEDLQLTRKQTANIDPQSLVETRAQAVGDPMSDGVHRILLESPSVSQDSVSYACVLVPCFEHHLLVGDVAARLNEWVLQFSVAFGWRLEYIAVRPDYLQWIERVPLNTAPGYVINTIRKHTSNRFFTEFPRFKDDNPSGEFWARGFIVQGGSQPHPQKQIRDFIRQTRMRQGLR